MRSFSSICVTRLRTCSCVSRWVLHKARRIPGKSQYWIPTCWHQFFTSLSFVSILAPLALATAIVSRSPASKDEGYWYRQEPRDPLLAERFDLAFQVFSRITGDHPLDAAIG